MKEKLKEFVYNIIQKLAKTDIKKQVWFYGTTDEKKIYRITIELVEE